MAWWAQSRGGPGSDPRATIQDTTPALVVSCAKEGQQCTGHWVAPRESEEMSVESAQPGARRPLSAMVGRVGGGGSAQQSRPPCVRGFLWPSLCCSFQIHVAASARTRGSAPAGLPGWAFPVCATRARVQGASGPSQLPRVCLLGGPHGLPLWFLSSLRTPSGTQRLPAWLEWSPAVLSPLGPFFGPSMLLGPYPVPQHAAPQRL